MATTAAPAAAAPPAAAPSGHPETSSEELVLELYDVLARCPPEARDAAADAALEAIVAAAPPPPPGDDDDVSIDESVAESKDVNASTDVFIRPSSGYDRYRKEMKEFVASEHPGLEPLAISEMLRKMWSELKEEEREPYNDEARKDRDAYEKRKAEQKWGDVEPWEADRPRRPATVFDLWLKATNPRDGFSPGLKEATIRRKISTMYAALDAEARRPYEEEAERASAAHELAMKAWAEKWDLVRCYKGFVPRTDPAAVARAERLAKEAGKPDEPRKPADPAAPAKPPKPLTAYNAWRREHVAGMRVEHPGLPHGKLERKLLARYKGLPEPEKKPYEDAYRALCEEWKASCHEWEAALKRHREEAGLDESDDESDADPAPTNPGAYPKGPDLWARDEKEAWRARFPDLAGDVLVRKMKAEWSSYPDDHPVKVDYKARSLKLKDEYAARHEAWLARQRERAFSPRKRRKAAVAADWGGGAGADSVLSKAAHFTSAQRALLEARRGLHARHPDHAEALDAGNACHEALARRFAAELGPEAASSPEILKHYYSKISNWVKRRPTEGEKDGWVYGVTGKGA